MGSGIRAGLGLTSTGGETSNFASSGITGVFSGTGQTLVSAMGTGGALGLDSAAGGGLSLVSGAAETVIAVDSKI